MLQSDAIFLYRHGIPLSAEEALQRSPSIAGAPGWPYETYWSCEFLRDGRKCQLDLEAKPKPKVCKGYPWYSSRPQAGVWLRPGCGYHMLSNKSLQLPCHFKYCNEPTALLAHF
jgi:hypothetical protein